MLQNPVVPDPLPPIAGREAEILAAMQQPVPPRPPGDLPPGGIRSAFACALHMHQPTIPAGPQGELISHLQYMFEHPGEGDNHNAAPFAHCYRRLADILPELIREGCRPRVMLDYSGTLLWGFQQMGRHDILSALQALACDPVLQPQVEWLGSFWGHAVASSTPIPDLILQIQAWQHQFAALFGLDALRRVRGFSPPEMHLPNHPDTLHAFVSALLACGYRWLLVQEHSVEGIDGSPLTAPATFLPHTLVARSSSGHTAAITALIKTRGSDTKLVGQMQPCFEALTLGPQPLGGRSVPPLVCQIADGENGGVMMNEFPDAFLSTHRRLATELAASGTVALNGSEYLDLLAATGVSAADFPRLQARGQHRIWQAVGSSPTPAATEAAIARLRDEDPAFSIDGASWTADISWVEGYANVLEPMQRLSARFHQHLDARVQADPALTATAPYRNALLHLLLLETSCFRYWGQGRWTDYAAAIQQRGEAAIAALG